MMEFHSPDTTSPPALTSGGNRPPPAIPTATSMASSDTGPAPRPPATMPAPTRWPIVTPPVGPMPPTRTASAIGATTGSARVPAASAPAVRPNAAGIAVPAATPAVASWAKRSAPVCGSFTPNRVRSSASASDGRCTWVPNVRLNKSTSGSATTGAKMPAAAPAARPGGPPIAMPAAAPASGSAAPRVMPPTTPAVVVSGSRVLGGATWPGAAPGICAASN